MRDLIFVASFFVAWGPAFSMPTFEEQEIRYTSHIAPLLSKHCSSCHTPGNQYADFSTYEKAFALRFQIQQRINSREMPYSGDFVDFEKQRNLINKWIRQGAKK